MLQPRGLGAVVLAGTVALTAAGCSTGTPSAGAAASSLSTSADARPSAPAPAPALELDSLDGVDTAAQLDANTLAALTSLQVTVTPTGKAKATTTYQPATFDFPITGGNVKVFTKDAAGHAKLDGTKVELTAQAAAALNKTFSVTAFQPRLLIGVAHITVR